MARIPRKLPFSLRTRILLLTLFGFLVVSVPAYFSFVAIVNSTVVKLGTLFAEKQILFDRYRGLGALMQEVKLAETLARSPAIREWALDEHNRERQARGIAELEHFRVAFLDKSYFFVVDKSGNYYFNDAQSSYSGKQLRYALDVQNPRDAWYYKTAALGEGCHLNVDQDDVLQVTKVWINCVIKQGDQVIGVLGSGLDLTAFIREVVDFPQTGVTAMFVDRSGAVQAHRDARLVDFHSLTKSMADKKTIYDLLDRPEDQAAMAAMLRQVTSSEVLVQSRFMAIGGHETLVGVGYLDRLGWYNVTFMDVDKVIDRGLFLPIGVLLGAVMVLCAGAIGFFFKRRVLDRLARVEGHFRQVNAGKFDPVAVDQGNDEISRMSRSFASMAALVSDNTKMLEEMVEARTEELRVLAYRDQLTGIHNRRGFIEVFEQRQRQRGGDSLGLLMIDVDDFKTVNDSFGHLAGDKVIVELAQRLSGILREVDVCGRWGGDEFIVLIGDIANIGLRPIADTVRSALTDRPIELGEGRVLTVTVSIGACLIEPQHSVEAASDMADAALYRAKAAGRHRVAMFDPQWERSA